MSLIDDAIPICYRADSKYQKFLINSIHSVLKFYKGKRNIIFYILTNDSLLDLSELDNLKSVYTNFTYEVMFITKQFLMQNGIDNELAALLTRRFYKFNIYDDLKVVGEGRKNNPFARSKLIISYPMLFLMFTKHKKIILLDTDTIIVDDIDSLFNVDVSNVVVAACDDWDDTETHTAFNPSVSVFNVKEFQKTVTPFIKEKLTTYLADNDDDMLPFAELIQSAICLAIQNRDQLDRSWNVPITHLYLCDSPKIYHFSESWSENELVINKYKEIVDKYLLMP